MDDPAKGVTTANPITNSIPAQSTVLPNKPRKLIKIFSIVIVLALITALVVGVYVTGGRKLENSAKGNIPAGYIRARDLVAGAGNLVSRNSVQIVYNGILTAVDPGKRWDLKKNGKTVSISQEGDDPISYYLLPDQKVISANDLKIGNDVTIQAFVDSETGNFSVVTVSVNQRQVINPPGGAASQSAAPVKTP